MTRLLKRRFVVSAMIAVTALLFAVVGLINGVNLFSTSRRVDQILTQFSDTQGNYTPSAPHHKRDASEIPPFPSPDDLLGARIFWVETSGEGDIVRVDTHRIFAVTQSEARQLAARVLAQQSRDGKIQQFRYRVTSRPEGGQFLLFLDVAAYSHQSATILWVSLAAAVVGWLIMLPLVMALSRQAVEPIVQNMEKQKQFVTNAGHELKTPLAIIMANTDALELHQGESKWSKNIRTQTTRLNGLMQNLLVLAKMDETGSRLPFQVFALDGLLRELLQPYLTMAEEKAVSVFRAIEPDVTLNGHRESIAQLISVLLDNAVKYTPPGGKISVTLQVQREKRILQISNSVDAPPETSPNKFFDRFYRGDAARTQKKGGYGIGLSAARTVVDAHRGTIQAKYDDGQMVFTVTL